jgi:hypothetical protein
VRKIPTIKFSQLLASVRDDLPKYDGEGMIDAGKLIKVVHRCNDVMGINIYDHKECIIPVKNFKGNLPMDFYKAEMALAVGEVTRNFGVIATGNHYEWTTVQNACSCEGGTSVCVTPLEQFQPTITYNTFIPLKLGENAFKCFSEKSPCRSWGTGKYEIDFEEDLIHTEFEEGLIYLSYMANMTDPDSGELLVPFHGRLNDYYEYSVKARILENMFLNTEADVAQALAYVKRERNLAFSEAVDFVTSKSYREWRQMEEKRQRAFYNRWYKAFYG